MCDVALYTRSIFNSTAAARLARRDYATTSKKINVKFKTDGD